MSEPRLPLGPAHVSQISIMQLTTAYGKVVLGFSVEIDAWLAHRWLRLFAARFKG
jgi:hypothetical protein